MACSIKKYAYFVSKIIKTTNNKIIANRQTNKAFKNALQFASTQKNKK